MHSSILEQELAPLKAQIDKVKGAIAGLEDQLRLAEAEIDSLRVEKDQFDALREVCNGLDRLTELDAGELFWGEVAPGGETGGLLERLRASIHGFESKLQAFLDRQETIKNQINHHLDDLEYLNSEVYDAYAREKRRQEEFVVEREYAPPPYREVIMPWTSEGESASRYRRAMLIALLVSLFLGILIPMIEVPIPDRTAVVEIPERLAMLVKKEPPKPEPPPKPKEEKKPEPEKPPEQETKERPRKETPKPTTVAEQAARKKAETTGVLAFKSTFADLMDETPVARLGAEARLSKGGQEAPGQAQASRSLVAMQAGGSSGGIGNSAVSRNIGSGGTGNSDRIGGVGFARVASSVAGLQAEAGRPVTEGIGPARTDEEIQIVFDRYKALLYRIYNKELRKNPTLRGKLLLRITIDTDGSVSQCKVESTDLASQELVAMIIERVMKFNFGAKSGVPKTTILYPIDFLPAG